MDTRQGNGAINTLEGASDPLAFYNIYDVRAAAYRQSRRKHAAIVGLFSTRLGCWVDGHRALSQIGGNKERGASKRGCYVVKGIEYRFADCEPGDGRKAEYAALVESAFNNVFPSGILKHHPAQFAENPDLLAYTAELIETEVSKALPPGQSIEIKEVSCVNVDGGHTITVDFHFGKFRIIV